MIGFEVVETLKGRGVPRTIPVNGYLDSRDDFNDQPPPYKFVRPMGRSGSCFANRYKRGALFLLLLKIRDGEYAVDWDPLAPVNEQLHSTDDPWLSWVKERAKRQAGK